MDCRTAWLGCPPHDAAGYVTKGHCSREGCCISSQLFFYSSPHPLIPPPFPSLHPLQTTEGLWLSHHMPPQGQPPLSHLTWTLCVVLLHSHAVGSVLRQTETEMVFARDGFALTTCVQDCSGHGDCDLTGTCICDASSLTGYWEPRTFCATCQEGYSGLDCRTECPGGSCFQCSDHGRCHDGLQGNGSCSCDGFWVGDACDRCPPGGYGVDCSQRCPESNGAVCAGRGTCDAGPAGDGLCTCLATPSDGYWGAPSCSDCDSLHYGDKCTSECPGYTCSGHGSCSSGMLGDGSCICNTGWTGDICALRCPGSTDTVECGGAGLCQPDGSCICTNPNVLLPDCIQCVAGKTGPTCSESCPVNPTGTTCSGHGDCQRDGTCLCAAGYAHSQNPSDQKACQLLCPGSSAASQCSGNGLCNAATATCTCFDDSTNGHWEGLSCNVCRSGWSGRVTSSTRGCTKPCPGNTPCSGRGLCIEGQCFCNERFCGADCATPEVIPGACSSCPTGTWSLTTDSTRCGRTCEGTTPCSGHGMCLSASSLTTLQNDCVCLPGYGSSDCSIQCPGGDTPCGGFTRGICEPDTLQCACKSGFGGVDCSSACPLDAQGRACTGNLCFDSEYLAVHGALPQGARLGECDCRSSCSVGGRPSGCARGFVGLSCSVECDCTALINDKIVATGSCDNDGSCRCITSPVDGMWGGPTCSDCAAGYYGETCTLPCGSIIGALLTGTTSGRQCVCRENWYDEDCTKPCVGIDPTTGLAHPSGVCSTHGKCNWGASSSGSCSCDDGFYGPECAVPCDATKCGHLSNWKCSEQGECLCLEDLTQHWGNIAAGCNVCNDMYWGADCGLPCDCSLHGTCDRLTGTPCKCFADSVRGFWAGTKCEKCADGRVGIQCTGKAVPITRTVTIDPRVAATSLSTVFADEEEGFIYAGGSPLVALTLRLEKGASASYPQLSASSGDLLGCRGASHGEAFFVTKHSGYVYFVMQPEPQQGCGDLRVLSMPGHVPQDGGVNFALSSVYHTADVAEGYRIVAVTTVLQNGHMHLSMLLNYTNGAAVHTVALSRDVTTAAVPTCSISMAVAAGALQSAYDVTASEDGLYVSGVRHNGEWGIMSVSRYSGCKVVVVHHGGNTVLGAPCDVLPCEVARRVTYFDGTLLVAVEGASGAGFAQINLCLGCKSYTIQLTTVRHVATVLEVDRFINVAYIGVNEGELPSVLSKLRFEKEDTTVMVVNPVTKLLESKDVTVQHPVLYGEHRMTQSVTTNGFAAEVLIALYPAESWRVMYGLLLGGGVIRIAPFLLYEVSSVHPPLSDTKGGTEVSITGNGFRAVDKIGPLSTGQYSPACRFGEADTLEDAVIVDVTTVTCVTGNINATTAPACEGDTARVTLYSTGTTLTQSNAKLLRVPSAHINDASPRSGHYSGQDSNGDDVVVTLRGYGFTYEPMCPECLVCAFYDSSVPLVKHYSVGPAMVTYVSPYEIKCKQPLGVPGASVGDAFVDVALDGQVYSDNPFVYTLTGDPYGVAINYENQSVTLRAAAFIYIPEVAVYVVDRQGHKLRGADTQERTLVAVATAYEAHDTNGSVAIRTTGQPLRGAPVFSFPQSSCSTGTVGMCSFSGIRIALPVTGKVTIRFADSSVKNVTSRTADVLVSLASPWASELTVYVTEGVPVAFAIQRQPSRYIPSQGALPEQPRLVLADEMGNEVTEYAEGPFLANAVIVSDPAGFSLKERYSSLQSSSAQTGVMVFEGVLVQAYFGPEYTIKFSLPSKPEYGEVFSHVMTREPCPEDQYSILWEQSCAPCPTPGGVCNGSDVIAVEPGFWRPENSSKIYKCRVFGACLGGSAAAEACSEETTGPTCSVCKEGYGKQPTGVCTECASHGETIGLVVVICFFLLIALVVWIIITLETAVDEPYAIIGRMLVSHLQMGQIGTFSNWGELASDLFGTQSKGSTINIAGFSALDCLLRRQGLDYYNYFIGYMLLPAVPMFIATLVYAFVVVRRTLDPSLLNDKRGSDYTTDSDSEGEGEGETRSAGCSGLSQPRSSRSPSPAQSLSSCGSSITPTTNNIYKYKFGQVCMGRDVVVWCLVGDELEGLEKGQ